MRASQRISPNAIEALKDALVAVFWFKRDLLAYLRAAVEDERLLDGIDWLSQDVYKRDSVGRFIDRIASQRPIHGEVLLSLMIDVADMDDFPRLAGLEDETLKVAAAREAVERLRRYIKPYEEQLRAEVAARERIEAARAEAEALRATSEALAALKADYHGLLGMDDAQRRGFAFEPWLRRLFDVFDLDPRAAFRIEGEQIDGGFTLDSTHFLLEGRWRSKLAAREDLDVFKAKVQAKAETRWACSSPYRASSRRRFPSTRIVGLR